VCARLYQHSDNVLVLDHNNSFRRFLQNLNFSLSDIGFDKFLSFSCVQTTPQLNHTCVHIVIHMNDCFHLSWSSDIFLKTPITSRKVNYAYGVVTIKTWCLSKLSKHPDMVTFDTVGTKVSFSVFQTSTNYLVSAINHNCYTAINL
jgi:hypothetical protein